MLQMVATGGLWPAGRRFGAEGGRPSDDLAAVRAGEEVVDVVALAPNGGRTHTPNSSLEGGRTHTPKFQLGGGADAYPKIRQGGGSGQWRGGGGARPGAPQPLG